MIITFWEQCHVINDANKSLLNKITLLTDYSIRKLADPVLKHAYPVVFVCADFSPHFLIALFHSKMYLNS